MKKEDKVFTIVFLIVGAVILLLLKVPGIIK